MIIDTQVHLWEASRPDRPWRKDRKPSLSQPFGPDDILPLMDAAGVDRLVIVPPGIMDTNNDFALECAARWPDRFAVMGLIDTIDPGIEEKLAHWLEQPGMLGVRTHLHAPEQARWGGERALDPFWSAVERYQVPIALFNAGNVSILRRALERYPNMKIVIDHLGLPLIDAGFEYPDFPNMLTLAEFPNTVVKVSTLPARSLSGWPFPEVHEMIRQVLEAYGPRRMMWGSDHTQTKARNRATYQEEVDLYRKGLPFLSEEDKEWILGRTAQQYLNWP